MSDGAARARARAARMFAAAVMFASARARTSASSERSSRSVIYGGMMHGIGSRWHIGVPPRVVMERQSPLLPQTDDRRRPQRRQNIVPPGLRSRSGSIVQDTAANYEGFLPAVVSRFPCSLNAKGCRGNVI